MDTNIHSQDAQKGPYEQFGTGSQTTGSSPEPSYVQIPRTPPYSSGGTGSTGVQNPSKKRNGLLALLLSAMLMLGMLLGGAGAGAVMLIAGNASAPAGASAQTTTATAANANTTASSSSASLAVETNQATINSIYKAVSPSVVMITSVVQTGNGRFGTGTGEATGTGIVIDKQGDILTNNHVIEGATSIKVKLADGSEYTATVAGTAPQDDLAVIKASVPSDKLVPAVLGDSFTVKIGDE